MKNSFFHAVMLMISLEGVMEQIIAFSMSLEKDSKQTFAVILPAELAKRYEDKNKELGSGRELMFFSFLGYFFLHCQLHIVGFFKNSNKKNTNM